jgi:uncharacterized protein YycO
MANHIDPSQAAAISVTAYDQIRPQIQSGDLLFCSGNYLVSKAIKKVTNSPWSHVGIIFVAKSIDRVLLLESVEDVGVRLAPLSKYLEDYENGKPYDGLITIARPANVDDDLVAQVAKFGLDQLTLPYNKEEIAEILARVTLGIGHKTGDGYICSELVYACFKSADYVFHDTDGFVTPEDVWTDDKVSLQWRVQ